MSKPVDGRGRPPAVTEEDEKKIIKLVSQGMSVRKIGELTGFAKSIVDRVIGAKVGRRRVNNGRWK